MTTLPDTFKVSIILNGEEHYFTFGTTYFRDREKEKLLGPMINLLIEEMVIAVAAEAAAPGSVTDPTP